MNERSLPFSETLWDSTLPVSYYLRNTEIDYRTYDSTRGKFVRAPEAIQKLIGSYPYWKDKGALIDSMRLTLLVSKTNYVPHEPVDIIHYMDVPRAGTALYIMGPKEVVGEYVNDSLTTPQPEAGDEPWIPGFYNGTVLTSPGVDYNFGITEYRFDKPGIYRIQWRMGKYASNILSVTVK